MTNLNNKSERTSEQVLFEKQIQKYESGANGLGLFKFRQCCVFFNTNPRDVLEIIDVEMWNQKQHPIIEINKEQNVKKD